MSLFFFHFQSPCGSLFFLNFNSHTKDIQNIENITRRKNNNLIVDVSVNVTLCTYHDICLLDIHVQVVLLAGKVDVLQKFLEGELVFSYQGHVICIAKLDTHRPPMLAPSWESSRAIRIIMMNTEDVQSSGHSSVCQIVLHNIP